MKSSIFTLPKENFNDITKLDAIKIKSDSNNVNKKIYELTLTENEYIPAGESWRGTYTFNYIEDKLLSFIHPYAILKTTVGYNISHILLTKHAYYWYECSNNLTILKMRADGVVFPNTYPLFVTAKIAVYNDAIFQKLNSNLL